MAGTNIEEQKNFNGSVLIPLWLVIHGVGKCNDSPSTETLITYF